MPRAYKCRKCGVVHPPPTGKHCRQQFDDESEEESETSNDILPMLRDLTQQMKEMKSEMASLRSAGVGGANNDAVTSPTHSDDAHNGFEQTSPASDLTPVSLRQKSPVMKQAADRLARIRWQDDEPETTTENTRNKSGGKKSGCMLVAAETVEERIDWPHMYVSRKVGGQHKGVAYGDLNSEEFTYGFMCMIESSKCKWDYRVMTNILRMIIQHSIAYTWENARAWYREMGVEVEQGIMEWSEGDRVREMRFSHIQTKAPERRENQDSARPPLRIAPAGTKACAAYQTRACEQQHDHAPFVHACAYCLRVCNAVCRHSEADCIRKVTDSAKNGKKRE